MCPGWQSSTIQEIPFDYSGTTYNIPWAQLNHKHVRTTDYVEVEYPERIGNEFVMVREDVSKVTYITYHVPNTCICDNDGTQLLKDAPSSHQVKI